MNNPYKLNTFFKILTVVITGYFIFELLFGIITGSFGMYGVETGGSSHHGGGGTSAITYYNLINALLILFVKLLVVLLLIVIIAGSVKWTKLMLNDNKKTDINKLRASRNGWSILIIAASSVGLIILISVLNGFNNRGSMGYMLNNNLYYYSNYPNISVIGFFQQFLIILMFLIAVVLGIEIYMFLTKKEFNTKSNLKNDSSKIVREIKVDPLLKAVSVITLSIIGIVFLFAIVNSVLLSGMFGNTGMGMGHQVGNMGYNAGFGIAGIIYLLIRGLMFILVISLVLVGLMYVKSLYESGKLSIFNTTNGTSGNTSNIIGVDGKDIGEKK
jgi:hypothetical protein